MNRRADRLRTSLFALWIIALLAAPAYAVIPSALGPMQALIAILPHLLVLLGAAFVAVLKPSTYRALMKYCWAHKGITLTAFAPVVFLVWGGTRLFSTPVTQEQLSFVEWTAFRGGADRCGSAPNSTGPILKGKTLWTCQPTVGAARDIDSSPTVVGNRLYFGLNAAGTVDSFGAICCADTDTGNLVWQYTGEGELNPPLQPVFSSPAIAGEFSDAVKATGASRPVGRFLISGEGYHDNQNSRMICLDLEPVRTSSGKLPPKLHWAVETTSHVEASPCVFEGKTYFGAGDDGIWCLDIASGKVKWHLEGSSFYYVQSGPQVEALAKLAGKTVVALGSPNRHWFNKTDSVLLLNVEQFKEIDPGAAPSWDSNHKRTITGKVSVLDAPPAGVKDASRVRIEFSEYFADAESPPIGARIGVGPDGKGGEARVFFGSGIDGQSVSCVDAETGKLIWRTKTDYPAFSAPTIVGDKVILGLSNGTYVETAAKPAGAVMCLSALDGKVLWQVPTADGVVGAVAVKDSTAYACARDGNLYIVDVNAGKLITTYATGATMVSSPAVTDNAVFMSTNQGKVFCINRKDNKFLWSENLTPGTLIISSPAAAGDKLFIGTQKKGLFCIANDTGERKTITKIAPWSGTGGNEMRNNVSGDTTIPTLDEKAERLWDEKKFPRLQLGAHIVACGDYIYGAGSSAEGKPGLACVKISGTKIEWRHDLPGNVRALAANENFVSAITEQDGKFELNILHARTGGAWKTLSAASDVLACTQSSLIYSPSTQMIACLTLNDKAKEWRRNVGDLSGPAALAHNLIFIATKSSPTQLLCLDDLKGETLWSTTLETPPITPPTVSGNKVLIALSKPDTIAAFNLVDGSALWKVDASKPPVSYLAASADHVAYLAANNRVYVHKTANGEQTHTVILGKGAQPPAIFQNSLIIAADDRAGGYDLSASNWSWSLADQKLVGKVLAPPVLANEIIWLSTEKLGLINVGQRK